MNKKEYYGNTAQFIAHILLAEYSVGLPKNPRKYTKYSREFLDNLTKIPTAQSAHRNCAVLPYINYYWDEDYALLAARAWPLAEEYAGVPAESDRGAA